MGIKETLNRLMGNKPPVAGVDIGHNSVKYVEITRTVRGYYLKSAEIENIDQGKGDKVTNEVTVSAIQRLASRTGIRSGRVVTSVSGEAVIVRPIPVPIVSEKKEEIALAVQGEARDFIPFDPSDVIMDYQRLGYVDAGVGNTQEVLVVAAQRATIGNHLDLISQAGIESGIVDAGATALMNAMIVGSGVGADKTVALVNIGSEITNIAIVRKNTARFARDLSVAGRNITKSIMSDLNVSYEEAERLKREYGLKALFAGQSERVKRPAAGASGPSSIVDEVYAAIDSLDKGSAGEAEPVVSSEDQANIVASLVEHVLGDIFNEVKRSLLFYENQMDGEAVDLILLSGGTALMPYATQYFEQNLEIQTRILQPLEQIENDYSEKERAELGPILATAIGLGLRCAA